jgi:hypothetical protein
MVVLLLLEDLRDTGGCGCPLLALPAKNPGGGMMAVLRPATAAAAKDDDEEFVFRFVVEAE